MSKKNTTPLLQERDNSGWLSVPESIEYRNLKKLVGAIERWWEMKRPLDWNRTKHLKNPAVNAFNDTDKRLMLALAKFLKGR